MREKPNLSHRRDILLLILSCIAILGLLARCIYLVITGILNFYPKFSSSFEDSILGALAMLFVAGMFLPILIYTLKRLKGQEILPAIIQPVKAWQLVLLATVWLIAVILGAVLARLFPYGWVLASPLFLLGISLPILCLVWIGAGGLPCGSRRLLWSVLGYGMVGSTLAAMLLEYMLIGIAVIGIGILAVINPGLQTTIDQVKTQVVNANAGDMQALLTVLTPYLTNPLVFVSILVFASVLTPLIEEAVKPSIIWFLGNHLSIPSEGFLLGALCGAGFAMMEGLLAASGATQLWGFSLAGRAAASLMHITSSGLFGWAIASARLEKRYGRLALTYLLSVGIHGMWNGSAILAVYGGLRMMNLSMHIDLPGVLFMGTGLGALLLELILMLTALPLINRGLRRSSIPLSALAQSDIIAPLATSTLRKTDGLDPKSN